jgi:hypothetical protein
MTGPVLTSNDGRYEPGAFFDEMFEAPGVPHPHYRVLAEELAGLSVKEFEAPQAVPPWSPSAELSPELSPGLSAQVHVLPTSGEPCR